MNYSLNNGIGRSEKRPYNARIVLSGFVCLLFLMATHVIGFAAEWSLLPSIGMKGYYNDNLLLTPSPHDPTYGYWISPAAEFAGKTERLEVSGKAALDFVNYYGGETSEFTNIFLPIQMRYRTEKDEWGFAGGFSRDNTLMGELQATGLVLRFTQRNMWNASPTWTRTLTENMTFQGTFQFTDTTYEDGLLLNLVNYQVWGGSASIAYQYSERDKIQLAATYTNFHTTNAPSELRVSMPGALATVSHQFSESVEASVYGGPRFLTSSSLVADTKLMGRDVVWVYGTSLSKRFEKAVLQASVGREIMPSGFGLLLQTDRARLTVSYNFSETIAGSFDISGYRISGVSPLANGGTLSDNRLLYFTPQVDWKLSEWWKMELAYSLRVRDSDSISEPVFSNGLTLMLTYYPPKLAISN
ncbi:MAG: hypothetical protein R3B37_11285 [Nitrospira sp.]|nr:hypothetical protein [Nitrospira sp.]